MQTPIVQVRVYLSPAIYTCDKNNNTSRSLSSSADGCDQSVAGNPREQRGNYPIMTEGSEERWRGRGPAHRLQEEFNLLIDLRNFLIDIFFSATYSNSQKFGHV